jgi:hypothetical protein
VPAYGLSVVPAAEAAALRQFVLSPVKGAISAVQRRPVPFDTYHTRRDGLATVDGTTLDTVVHSLETVIAAAG